MVKLSYEQPSLKKYGTMKDFTLAGAGSGGDAIGRNLGPINDPNTIPVKDDFFTTDFGSGNTAEDPNSRPANPIFGNPNNPGIGDL